MRLWSKNVGLVFSVGSKTVVCVFRLAAASSIAMPRSGSVRSLSSDAESYRSAMLPPADRNLLGTDSSSYASVDERCLSPSTASYHTALTGDTSSASSIAGYETPTPQFDDDQDTLSSHSSLSDISHAETLEPNGEGNFQGQSSAVFDLSASLEEEEEERKQ